MCSEIERKVGVVMNTMKEYGIQLRDPLTVDSYLAAREALISAKGVASVTLVGEVDKDVTSYYDFLQ